jgi:hypothetical protein
MEQTYYERNKERIKEYYMTHQAELKQKALDRYYKKKQEKIESGEFVPKRVGRPRKQVEKIPYEFKIEHLNSNLTQE